MDLQKGFTERVYREGLQRGFTERVYREGLQRGFKRGFTRVCPRSRTYVHDPRHAFGRVSLPRSLSLALSLSPLALSLSR
jgi:hypothetical protein